MNKKKELWYSVAGFILDNKVYLSEWLNQNYGTSLTPNSSLERVNEVVAYLMINNPTFIEELISLQNKIENDGFYNWVVQVAQAVAALGEMVGNIVINAKNAVFSREQSARLEQYNYETEEFYKELAEVRANKEVAIELGKAQSDIVLKREKQADEQKRTNVLMMFGIFAIGAVALAFVFKNK